MSDGEVQAGGGLGDLPVYAVGWAAAECEFASGDAFWAQMADIQAKSALAGHLDQIMAGKSVPRVWLILHEPGQPELSALAALSFARELATREQVALVLDCDDQAQSLTRWIERIEREGWIDLARYGTSVLTSGVSIPYEGSRGYVLGVGSFAPTDVTAAEIQQLVARLRRQADDVFLVAPADHIGRMWAEAAGIRLLCWDRRERPAAELADLVETFAAEGHGLSGLLGFGEPAAVAAGVEAARPQEPVIGETDEACEPAPVPVAATPATSAPDPAAPPVEPVVDPAAPEDDFVAPTEAVAPIGDQGLERAAREDREPWPHPEVGNERPTRKNTSGVFWFVATASVVIVTILGAYWYKYVRVPKEGHFATVKVATRPEVPVRVPGDQSRGDMANHDDLANRGELANRDELASRDETAAGSPGTADAASGAAVVTDSVVAPGFGVMPAGGTQAPVGQAAEAETAGSPEVIATPPASRFSLEPYQGVVGADGWALHLYSFPDSASTTKELAELKRRGFATEVRVVQIKDKGRWWRVYVGSFPSRAAARAAAGPLKAELRTDWADPARF